MITLVSRQRWNWINVDWHTCAQNRAPLWTRLSFYFSAGWHAWNLGIVFRIAPRHEAKRFAIGIGPFMIGMVVWPWPQRCECCGLDANKPSEDCLAHPPVEEVDEVDEPGPGRVQP